MRLENEFEVDADIKRSWLMLTDLEQVMPCIPGASMDGRDGDTYRGNVKIKVGPIGAHLHGTAHFESRDDDAHEAVIRAVGKDNKGSASVNSAIHARLQAVGPERTRVILNTDLDISGRMAQFGRGAIADVGTRILNQFAANIGTRLGGSAPAAAPAHDGAAAAELTQSRVATPATPDDEGAGEMKVLDLIVPMVKERYGQAALGAVVGLALGWLLFGRASAPKNQHPAAPPPYWEYWSQVSR